MIMNSGHLKKCLALESNGCVSEEKDWEEVMLYQLTKLGSASEAFPRFGSRSKGGGAQCYQLQFKPSNDMPL